MVIDYERGLYLDGPEYDPPNPRARPHCQECGSFVSLHSPSTILTRQVGYPGSEWTEYAEAWKCPKCGRWGVVDEVSESYARKMQASKETSDADA